MSRDPEVWRLYARDVLAAKLVVTGGDFPWLEARVEAHTTFASFRSLFDDQHAAMEAERWDEAERLSQAVSDAVRLVDPRGVAVPEFLLRIQGDTAWWRWSYEPFGDE